MYVRLPQMPATMLRGTVMVKSSSSMLPVILPLCAMRPQTAASRNLNTNVNGAEAMYAGFVRS